MEPQEGAGEGRAVGGDALQLLQARRGVGEQRIGRGLAQIGDEAVDVVGGEGGEIHPEGLAERDEDAGRHRTLVVLDLVEIGDGEAEALGEGRLGQPRLLAQAAQRGSDEDLARHQLLPIGGASTFVLA